MSVLTGTSQAQVLSPDKGYTVKKVSSSNTFIVKRGNRYTEIKHVLELVENPLDLEKIHDSIPSSSIWNLLPPVDVQGCFYLGDSQIELVEKELKLLKLSGGYAKINYKDMADVACYISSVKECSDFGIKMDIYPEIVKEWALRNFTGDPAEVALHCLLACDEGGNMEIFLKSWEEMHLDEVNIGDLTQRVNSTFIPQKKKERLQQYLNKLTG
ncbi:hypothetical protein P7C65_05s2g08130 [Encephalitozoon intestinalis]